MSPWQLGPQGEKVKVENLQILESFKVLNERMNDLYFRPRGEYQWRYRDVIGSRIRTAHVTLDLGAGRMDVRRYWELSHQKLDAEGLILAVDMDRDRLAKNPNKLRVAADARLLPFKDGSIDLIVTQSMFEHLEKPDAVLSEAGRLLKSGGALIFATPYKFSYISLAAAMTPLRFHIWHARMQGHQGDAIDCCATLYRLNTVRDIKKFAQRAGLAFTEFSIHVGEPQYTLFLPPPLHFLFILFHKIVNRFSLTRRAFGLNLVGVLEKP